MAGICDNINYKMGLSWEIHKQEAGCQIPLPIRCRLRFSAPKPRGNPLPAGLARTMQVTDIQRGIRRLRGAVSRLKNGFSLPTGECRTDPASSEVKSCRDFGARRARALGRRACRMTYGQGVVDQPHRALGHRTDCDALPGSAARAKRISAESECEPVFFMTAAR
jgi:hypothetical protein